MTPCLIGILLDSTVHFAATAQMTKKIPIVAKILRFDENRQCCQMQMASTCLSTGRCINPDKTVLSKSYYLGRQIWTDIVHIALLIILSPVRRFQS